MKLYYSPGACSLSPHIVLRESGLAFELEGVDLQTRRTASGADFLQINPKGYVPALRLSEPGDGEVLTEGPAIVQYVADLAPDKRLAPSNGSRLRYHLQAWLNFIAAELHKQFAPLWSPDTPPGYAEKLRGKIGERFSYLQEVLSDRGYLLGDTYTVADSYLFVMMQWASRFRLDLPLWPNLDDYESRIARRPAVRAAIAAEGLAATQRRKYSLR